MILVLMYHSHYIFPMQSILVFSIASDENFVVETKDFRGKAACYTPDLLNFLWISKEAVQKKEIHGNRKNQGNLRKYHVIT